MFGCIKKMKDWLLVCKSKEGSYYSHCFHPKSIKVDSCKEGSIVVKHWCCRCGCIEDIHHHYY